MEARIGREDGALQHFLGTPVEELVLGSHGDVCPDFVMDQLLKTASDAGKSVPAYRQLLEEKGLDPGNLQLSEIPIVTKENYFRKYPIPDRCWNGDVSRVDFVHCSSGSSGRPQLWSRNSADEITVTGTFELVFHDSFEAHMKRTLVMVCFPLGSWVGGIFTTKCLSYLALKGYKLCIVTPGNKPDDIILLTKELAPLFDQTVLAGYPPFLKGVVDKGISQGVHWPEFGTKLLLAGEVFSEEWRALMGKRCGMKNPCQDIVSMYGTADAGVIAAETHLSSIIRKWLSEHPEVALELFGRERLPTLCQYSPENKLIEHNPENLTIVVSTLGKTHGASPLLRYGIGDAGGSLSYQQMLTTLESKGLDIPEDTIRRVQPFVWVFGRSFWVVSIYGANVYVENIMVGLEQPEMGSITTGKFVLFVEEDMDLNPRIGLHVELVPGKESSIVLCDQVAVSVTQQLLRLNSEYANYVPADFQTPKVYLHAFGTPEYFPIGVKHSYMMK